MNRNPEIEEHAAQLYADSLPYHNFDHALRVLANGETILDRCQKENIPVNEQVVYYAMLLHDAGYQEDEEAKGFASKEAYAAHLAATFLRGHDVGSEIIAGVKVAILCTHVDGHCYSNEDRLVRKADLSGMAADYESFRDDTINLKREYEILNHCEIPWSEWKPMAERTIEHFIREDMALISSDLDEQGNSIFRDRVRENVRRMMSDTSLQ